MYTNLPQRKTIRLKDVGADSISARFGIMLNDAGNFDGIVSASGNEGLSAKAMLATAQRIPGLGNGVLQDILYNAGIHPKKKVKIFKVKDKEVLFDSIKTTLAEMTFQGGSIYYCEGCQKL